MGFSGGGSNVLLPHTHDGTVSQDGGPLNFNNITQSQSAQGEVFYSDGVHLQQLAFPAVPAGETLTAVAASTEPAWVASTPASAAMELISSTTLAAGAPNITITPAVPISWDDVSCIRAVFSGSQSGGGLNLVYAYINGIAGAGTYYQAGDRNGAFYNMSWNKLELEGNSNTQIFGYIDMYGQNSLDGGTNDEIKFIAHTQSNLYYMTAYGQTTTGVAHPTFISFEFAANNPTLDAGTTVSLYRINNS